jgi:hypothetical protein
VAYTLENLLTVLRPHCPAKVDALCKNRRRVEYGLTTDRPPSSGPSVMLVEIWALR